MGIFSEIKKLVFGVESVGKSAIEKGMDMAKGHGNDLVDKAEDLGKSALEKTSGLRDAILHQAEGTIDMVNKSETLKKVATRADEIGNTVLSKGEELLEKGGDFAESIGEKILGENNENLEKVKEMTKDIGDKVMDAKEKMIEKAHEVMDDVNDKIDETLDRAKAEEMAESAEPKKDLKDVLEENEGSLIEDDDFFSKAAKFAKGDYSGVLEGTVTIGKAADPVAKKEPAKAAGFTDHDGDGNEIVDDAVIIEDSSEEE